MRAMKPASTALGRSRRGRRSYSKPTSAGTDPPGHSIAIGAALAVGGASRRRPAAWIESARKPVATGTSLLYEEWVGGVSRNRPEVRSSAKKRCRHGAGIASSNVRRDRSTDALETVQPGQPADIHRSRNPADHESHGAGIAA